METRKLKIDYPLARIGEPVITRLVTEFDLVPNLLRADVDAHKGGWMIAEVTGEKDSIDNAIRWMQSHGLTITEA
jgi:ABC-type methionine transport system ATPase subunit